MQPGRSDARANRELVRLFFQYNPFATQQDCIKATGLSVATVNRHYQSLRDEYRAENAGFKQVGAVAAKIVRRVRSTQ